MAEIRDQVAGLLQDGWEPCTDDEVRVEHEAATRRMWLPRGKRTRLSVDRAKASRSFLGAPGLTTRKMENTFAAFTAYITNRTFDYDFEHIPVTPPHTDLV